MTAAYAQSLAHRSFLTLPLLLVILGAAVYPVAAEHWDSVRNASLAYYVAAIVFLKTAAFEKNAGDTTSVHELVVSRRTQLVVISWALGIGLTFASLVLAKSLHILFDVPSLLGILF
jgi:hypothetical protein